MKRPVYNSVVLRGGLATVLLVAAGLKCYVVATNFLAMGLLVSDSLWLSVAILEIVLAIWTLCGPVERVWWWAMLCTFLAFGAYAAWEVSQGVASCGCFGRLQMNPLYAVCLDITIIAMLLVFRRPTPRAAPSAFMGPMWGSVCAAVVILASVGFGAAWERHSLGDRSTWPPDRWPLSRFSTVWKSDLSAQLARGKWIVVVYREGCPRCLLDVRHYETLAEKLRQTPDASKVALLELPPYYSGPHTIAAPGRAYILGKVTAGPITLTPSMTSMIVDNDIIKFVAVP